MIGRVIGGKYLITEHIGSGGMANVYKAVEKDTNHVVAVKALKDEFLEDQEFVRRFGREAQAVVSLSHDNIVRSLGVISEEGGRYIILEYIEGQTAKELLKEHGRFEARKAIHIATQICDALIHAHERGIIHRDIKPQNVLINARGRVKLTDFGIARDASASTTTFAGTNVLGSVHYISPEQARGEVVDAKSDIYSLGVSLYELATGTLPFTGETNVAIALKHLNDQIEPPAGRFPDMPRALNDIILRATNKNPLKRYQSAREMKQDLLRALREPDGKFVKLDADAPAKRAFLSPIATPVRLAFMLFIALGLLAVAFFIVTRPRIDETQLFVPNLVGRPEEDALDLGSRRGFNVEIGARINDEGSLRGDVIAQEPPANTPARGGEVITLTVSEGPTVIAVPNLYSSTLDEAVSLLESEGLLIGQVQYELVENAPEGVVIRQDPIAGEQLLADEPINIWINEDPSDHVDVPSLAERSLEDAMLLAEGQGFESIFVREIESQDGVPEGTVLGQSPSAEEIVPKETPLELQVTEVVQRDYACDISFNLDIVNPGTRVFVTFIAANGAQYIVYDERLPTGMQTVPVRIESNDEKDKTVIVYEDGLETRREIYAMTPKNTQ